MGLNRNQLKNIISLDNPIKIKTQHFIENKFVDSRDAYIVDIESYCLNSKIRSIQLFDVANKTIQFRINGDIQDKDKVLDHLKKFNVKIDFRLFDSEEKMIVDFFKFIHDNPKTIIGHNVAHFDLGLLQMKKTKYNINDVKFFSYITGSGATNKKIFFSYVVKDKDDDSYWWKDNDKKRHLIIDTLLMAFTLKAEESDVKVALMQLSRQADSKYPKKNINHKVWESDILNSESVLYACYDVLSIPDVLKYLCGMIKKASEKFLKIKFAQSQLCIEHVWMKGSGALAEGFLHKLLGNSINMNVPDYLSKYFGGYTRCWNKDLVKGDIKYLDFASAYPFSIRKQGVMDVLNGNFEYITNKSFHHLRDKYDDFIYSTTFRIKAKEKINILLEVEKDKKDDKINIGFLRSFNKDMRIQNMQHQLSIIRLLRGDSIILTKTELEISKTFYPDIMDKLEIISVIDGMIATSGDKSEQYIQLYKIRQELKEKKDDANVGFKVLLNSVYGKIAENRGEWFNLACASAITGFVRSMLLKTIIYSQSLGAKILYNDTDGFYCCNISNIQLDNIIDYAEKLNEYPARFNIKNLKIEDEKIVAFWGIKRKNYVKIIKEKDENVVVLKGVNGNSDIRWRDILFRLSALTNGCIDIKGINKKIQNNDLELHNPILKSDEGSLRDLQNQLKKIKKDISGLRVGLSNKQKNWIEFFDKIYPIVEDADDYGESLADEEEASVSYNSYFRKLAEHFGFDYDIKNPNMFLYIFEKLKEEYNDPDILLLLLSGIGDVDLSFYVEGINDNSGYLDKELSRLRKEIKNKTYDFEKFCNKIYQEYKDKKISDFLSVKINATITRKLNVHLRSSTTYINGGYYRKIVDAWKNRIGEEAYCGLFFSINRDYSFHDKDAEDLDWGLNYENYYKEDDMIPCISSSFYNTILNQEIRLDTIRLKSRNPINMFNLNPEERKICTTNIMMMGFNGITKRCHDLNNYYPKEIFRLRIPQNLSVDDTTWLNKDKLKELKNDKDDVVYSNATLFLTNRILFEGAIRINKVGMFIKQRNIFNIYRFFSKLGCFAQQLIKKKLAEKKISNPKKEDKKIVCGIELDYIPRFTFCSQADVNQEITYEELGVIHKKSFDYQFRNRGRRMFGDERKGMFLAIPLLEYFHVIAYDKKGSAENKIQNQMMEDWERKEFEKEQKEDCRLEIKFKLKRNFYETLSYIFSINCIDQREIGYKLLDMEEKKFARKMIDIEFNSKFRMHVEFNQNKCSILFDCLSIQEYELRLNEEVAVLESHLEGAWDLYVPPKQKDNQISEKYKVRWRFETERMLDVAKEEVIKLESIRDF